MTKKTAWHTDIVVGGQGIGLKVAPSRGGCYRVELKPDAPGKSASKAKARFGKAMGPKECSVSDVKGQVERAIKRTRARWNRWHREAY
jgi:hypothetical protein